MPTRPRGAASRALLLRTAAEELAGNGTLEVAAVARRAGVSVGLPYRYFGTRSGLLIAVVESFYERLAEACMLREYDDPTWVERESRRVRDWVGFLYAEPLAPLVLGGHVGDGEVAAFQTRRRSVLVELAARNIARAQRTGELPPRSDPELLAAATLAGASAMVSVALTRTPRPPAEEVTAQVWAFLRGAVNLSGTAA
ncbi:TetR/AcrR family transcriptional regulator [Streptomyces sp. HNM0645]|uniref:TetR/AcrR family transcriptional regulator n=1 Tax=Streptomyces sp. HNM0645 TaxID=2782343 RepID=UPI0024B8476A|nr:TetR/AcrR family transcriptional regulator [Streptomyces sp. HNM0645]MDI9883061.1 TetR/AcrR family transcriptional regulator [Streptomyces sp. HNM0645]